MPIKQKQNIKPLLSKYSTQAVLILLLLYGLVGVRHFMTGQNLSAILYQYSIIGLLAVGQFLVILTGGIDLSLGAVVALTSISTALVMEPLGMAAGIIAGIISGTMIGVLNGFLVSRTTMPPFLVTLGTQGVARGLAMQLANAKPVPVFHDGFMNLGIISVGFIPLSTFIWGAVCLGVAYMLYKRKTGIYIYAVGCNEENARLSGIGVKKIKFLVYVLAALLTSIAGVLWTARLGAGSSIGGVNYELESIAAVVVGGGSLAGGIGDIWGVVCGVLIFGVINSILNLSGISPFWQGMLKGAIIIVAITIRQFKKTASN